MTAIISITRPSTCTLKYNDTEIVRAIELVTPRCSLMLERVAVLYIKSHRRFGKQWPLLPKILYIDTLLSSESLRRAGIRIYKEYCGIEAIISRKADEISCIALPLYLA